MSVQLNGYCFILYWNLSWDYTMLFASICFHTAPIPLACPYTRFTSASWSEQSRRDLGGVRFAKYESIFSAVSAIGLENTAVLSGEPSLLCGLNALCSFLATRSSLIASTIASAYSSVLIVFGLDSSPVGCTCCRQRPGRMDLRQDTIDQGNCSVCATVSDDLSTHCCW